MKKDVADYVTRCLTYQKVKTKHQKPGGLLQPLTIPAWKWEHIIVDFIASLPRTTKQRDAIWIIIDRLTKAAHFLALKITFSIK